jgi:hypothetical protein
MLVGETVGQVSHPPRRAAAQARPGDAQRERQVPTVLGHLLRRVQVGIDAPLARHPGEKLECVPDAQRLENELLRDVQAIEQPPAGRDHQTAWATGQHQPDLLLVVHIVQEYQRTPPEQHRPVERLPFLHQRRDLIAGNTERSQETIEHLSRFGRNPYAAQIRIELRIREFAQNFVRELGGECAFPSPCLTGDGEDPALGTAAGQRLPQPPQLSRPVDENRRCRRKLRGRWERGRAEYHVDGVGPGDLDQLAHVAARHDRGKCWGRAR